MMTIYKHRMILNDLKIVVYRMSQITMATFLFKA